MRKIKAIAFFIIAAFSLLLFIQPVTGGEAGETGGITGTWKGKGVDTRGVKWEFTFTLTQKDGAIEGESSWEGSDGSTAKSVMKGKINFAKKTFILKDVDINDISGDIAAAVYTGTFSDDFKKMKGKWTIPNGGSPGTFEAVKE